MGRKRKHTDAADDTKAHLPPCRVCDAPGAGFHYGANTCEACKGSQYKCDGQYCCVIEHGHQKLCQYCRYQKCLLVGMAKEAIKTGRYTSIKRTNDILEIKKLQEKTKKKSANPSPHRQTESLANLPVFSSDIDSETSLGCENQSDQCPVLFTDTLGDFSVASVTEIKTELPDCYIGPENADAVVNVSRRAHIDSRCQMLAEAESQRAKVYTSTVNLLQTGSASHVSTLPDIEYLFSMSPQDSSDVTLKLQQKHNDQLSLELSPLSLTSPYGSPSGSTMKPSPSILTDVASSLLSLSTAVAYSPGYPPASLTTEHSTSSTTCVTTPSVPLTSPGAETISSPSSSLACGLSSSSHSNLDIEMYISNSPSSLTDSAYDVREYSVSEMYQDKDRVVRILLEGDENFVVPLAGRMTQEEIKRQQQEHFEACRLQREMFGQLRRLPDHEYDYIFATTGLDTDDRQKRLRIMGAGLEKVIRAMVKFCKVIPGFSRLDISDKVRLIKYSRQEFCLFTIYKFIDAEKKIMRGLDNQWKCENDISRMSTTDSDSRVFMENLDLHFRFCDSLQNLQLTDEELVVIRAIIIMAPDRSPHTDSPTVRDIYWQLNECLIHVLSRRYTNALIIYAKIISKLTEARSQTETMLRFFKRLKIEKYSNVMNNPLLREMCSGIFFDEKDDDIITVGS
ncbi:unnamed protein product [Candidula unifasciata]|uniref:Uncharacterized protein n=1 Tax=Candidula unifasciata TaxID=100452 RepID=A0A8S3Z6A1_9EUPU|nr:unnamed protein product [Candidula unifasciata]